MYETSSSSVLLYDSSEPGTAILTAVLRVVTVFQVPQVLQLLFVRYSVSPWKSQSTAIWGGTINSEMMLFRSKSCVALFFVGSILRYQNLMTERRVWKRKRCLVFADVRMIDGKLRSKCIRSVLDGIRWRLVYHRGSGECYQFFYNQFHYCQP